MFTPPLRELTPGTSMGFLVIEFATTMLGLELYPWQRWALIHALERLPDGSFRFRTVVILVARQNGKSTLFQVLALFFMYVLGRRLVLGTAQDLDTAEETWQGAVDLVDEVDDEDRPLRPELFALKRRTVLVNGKKSLELVGGERYKVKAASRRAARGLSGDLIGLDELREHQSWDAWGAITKTTMARDDAMVWALSNAGDAASIVLRYLRKMAHRALGDPDGINVEDEPDPVELEVGDEDTLGIFEWSAAPGCDVWDRDGWAQANPSLGQPGSITERTIASACRTDPDWVFRIEVLCQWLEGSLEGPFPFGAWDAGMVGGESQIVGKVRACVDASVGRGGAHVALAGRTADGTPQVELVATNLPLEGVLPWLMARTDVVEQVCAVTRGAPVSSLIPDWVTAGLPVVDWVGQDVANATGSFYDLVRTNGLKHTGPNAPLDLAAATAVPRMSEGGAFTWDRKRSATDVSPLIAATGAVWLLTAHEPDVPPASPQGAQGTLSPTADLATANF